LARIGFPFSAYGVVSYTATRSSLFLPWTKSNVK
jgi:hypothetical protein